MSPLPGEEALYASFRQLLGAADEDPAIREALLEVAASSALQRTESRGVHFRADYPVTNNDEWLKESLVRKTNEGFELATRSVSATSLTPPGGSTPYLDMVKRMMQRHSEIGGHH